MLCKNCGSEINSTGLFCQKCGAMVSESASETKLVSSESEVNTESAITPDVADTVPEIVESAPETAQNQVETPVKNQSGSMAPVGTNHDLGVFGEVSHVGDAIPVKKPKSKLKKRLLKIFLPIILVIAIAVSVYANPVWRNSFLRLILSEETYFKYVMGTNIKGYLSDLSSDFEMIQNIAEGKNSVNAEVQVEFGDAGNELIRKYGGFGAAMVLSWFDSVGLSLNAGRSGDMYGLDLGLMINGSDAITANGVFADDGLYISVPKLNDNALFISVGDDMSVGTISETLEQLGELFPSKEVITNMITRYALCIVDNVSDIDEKDITLTAGGVKQKAIQMTVKIDGKSLIKIAEACLKEMKKDKDIKGIIEKACERDIAQGDFDEVYEEFLSTLDEGLESVEEAKEDSSFEETEIFLRFIANNRGELIGMDVEYDGGMMKYYNTKSGGKYGTLLSFESDGQVGFSYEACGTTTGGEYNGEGTLKAMGMDIMNIKLEHVDKAKYDKGIFNGKIVITPDDSLEGLLSMANIDSDTISLVSDMEIVIESSDTEEYKGGVLITASTGGEVICKLTIDYDLTQEPDFDVPDSYIDLTEEFSIEDWLEECKEGLFETDIFPHLFGMLSLVG